MTDGAERPEAPAEADAAAVERGDVGESGTPSCSPVSKRRTPEPTCTRMPGPAPCNAEHTVCVCSWSSGCSALAKCTRGRIGLRGNCYDAGVGFAPRVLNLNGCVAKAKSGQTREHSVWGQLHWAPYYTAHGADCDLGTCAEHSQWPADKPRKLLCEGTDDRSPLTTRFWVYWASFPCVWGLVLEAEVKSNDCFKATMTRGRHCLRQAAFGQTTRERPKSENAGKSGPRGTTEKLMRNVWVTIGQVWLLSHAATAASLWLPYSADPVQLCGARAIKDLAKV